MSPLARFWRRLPVVVRAVLVGSVVLTAGGLLTGPLIFANLRLWPEVPWSVPLLAAYLWLSWQYLRGRWWPRTTAEARRQGLRANRLSPRMCRWALAAGYLALVSVFALQWVVGRVVPLRYAVPELLQELPFFTLLSILFMLSAVAGVVEEAAFRGFMQGPIERRHGVTVAILVVSLVFGLAHLTDWQPGMTLARMFFIVLAAVVYGILVHLVDSILPGIVLHATGDAIGISWIWWLRTHSHSSASEPGFAVALTEPSFWVAVVVAVGFGGAAVWAFRRLAVVAQSELRALVTFRGLGLYSESVRFEWDLDKAAHNLAKHGVSFEEAATVFEDDLFVIFDDPDHSETEVRHLILGMSRQGRLLVVAHTENQEIVRVISARRSTRRERTAYESEL